MLHAPDFLGYDGAVEMARDRRDIVETALRLKKAGNELMRVVGGREVHPINLRVGGIYRAPSRAELRALVPELEWAREASLAFTRWVAGFDFPDFEQDYEFVALRQPGEYAIERGRLVSSTGLDIAVSEYERALHGVARRALQRPALDARGCRQLPRRPAGALCPQLPRAVAARPRDRRGG